MESDDSPQHTPEAPVDGNATTGNSIPQKSDSVNRKLSTDALVTASGREQTKNTAEGGVKWATNEQYSSAVASLEKISDEQYLRDKSEVPYIMVMEHTPELIRKSMPGANDRKILIRRDALYLAIRESGVQEGHYHGLGVETLQALSEYLSNPDVILSTNQNGDRRLVLTHIESKNGQAVISVEFETQKEFDRKNDMYNIVITVFDLRENYFKRPFKKNSAEVLYKKEDLAQVNPQLYEWLRTVNATSSANSIPQESDSVNRKLSTDALVTASGRTKNTAEGGVKWAMGEAERFNQTSMARLRIS